MDASPAGTGTARPRIVIVGAGISGLVMALMLAGVPAEVVVLEQALPPGRKPVFSGVVSASDVRALGLDPILHHGVPVARIVHVDLSGAVAPIIEEPEGWVAVEHGRLLDAVKASIASKGVMVRPDATVTGFLWDQGVVSGVLSADDGTSYRADLVVLADESSPRLAEQLGLRPDWSPFELMHVGKRKYAAAEAAVRDRLGVGTGEYEVMSFTQAASWGSPGWGLVIPGPDSITITVAMSLEEAMASTRHISEYLDEIEQQSPVRELVAGLTLESSMTEVVPTGGFDSRNIFHTGGVIVANDLVGVTHPLNRDGLSANLAVCQAAAQTIANAVASNDFSKRALGQFSKAIVEQVISPVDAARRIDTSLRARSPWLWASKADLFPAGEGVTAGPKSATLSGMGNAGAWRRLRGIGRVPGVRRHAPGAHDE